MKPNIVYTATVGSKMHGLDTPNSDEDIRYITMQSIESIINPFNNDSLKVKSDKGDTESWELRHFVKLLSQGNPTCYEVIKTPLYVQNEFAEEFRSLFPYFLDTKKILAAHCGYAIAQIERYLKPINSVTPNFYNIDRDKLKRIPKSIVAGYRVLAQGKQLLTIKDFCANIKDYDKNLHHTLMEIKLMDIDNIDGSFIKYHYEHLNTEIRELENVFDSINPKNYITPNYEKILMFLLKWYR